MADLLRELVGELLAEAAGFEDWLSPDVVEVLLRLHARKSDMLGSLSWEYARLPHRTWGAYDPPTRRLLVNKAKTRGLFSQQVQTVLHEIQHWNQHAEHADATGDPDGWIAEYAAETRRRGYRANRFEADARDFADRELEGAMDAVGRHYGGKVEGGSFEAALEELFDEFADSGRITRGQIGAALVAHDANTPENVKRAVAELTSVGMRVG